MAEPFIGEIKMFGGNFAPRNWALCDGQLLPISEHQALFSLLGTTYGGDGRTTFALPDLRGRAALHFGQGAGLPNFVQGQRSGQTEVTLTTQEMPSHTHTHTVTQATYNVTGTVKPKGHAGLGAKSSTPINNFPTELNDAFSSTSNGDMGEADVNLNTQLDIPADITIGNSGNSTAHNNMQPYLVVNFIIALQGLFPSRS